MIPLVSATSECWAFAALLLSLMLKFLFWPPCNIKSVCLICHQSGSLVSELCTPVSLFWLTVCEELVRCVPVVFAKVNIFFFSHNQSFKFSLSFNYIALILVPRWSKVHQQSKQETILPQCASSLMSYRRHFTFFFIKRLNFMARLPWAAVRTRFHVKWFP